MMIIIKYFIFSVLLLSSAWAQATGPVCQDLFSKKYNVVVVGPVSGGKWYANEIKRWGHSPYYIIPAKKLSDYNKRSFYVEDYLSPEGKDRGYTYGSVQPWIVKLWNNWKLKRWMKANKIDFAIAGSDSGIELAEYINEKLGVLPNLHPFVYKDKFKINKLLEEAGLPYTREVKISTYKQVLKAIQNGLIDAPTAVSPLFVKPREGMGAFGAGPVFSMEALKNKINEVIGQPEPNGSGKRIKELLVSEFLGDPTRPDLEFIVDIVSRDGHNVVAMVANYIKRDMIVDEKGKLVEIVNRVKLYEYLESGQQVHRIYQYDHYLPLKVKDPELDRKIQGSQKFAHEVIAAIGRLNGITHIEIMWTEKGPMLVEANARAAGGSMIEMTKMATGTSEIEIYMESLFAPWRFKERTGNEYQIKDGKIPRIIQPAVLEDGKYLDHEKTRAFAAQFPGFQEFRFYHADGAPMKKTTNLINSIGEALYLFESKAQEIETKKAFKEAEESGLFLSNTPIVPEF